jgi:hypothetical protein
MLLPLLLAAFPAVLAQDAIETATRCNSRFGYYPIPTGAAGAVAVPTWYQFLNITSVTRLTTEVHDTVTATYNATTQMNMLTTTVTFSATTTSTPAAVTIAASAGFIPMLANNAVLSPTPITRIKRHEEHGHALQLLKRQTSPNYTSGFFVGRNGTTSSLDRKYVYRVDCRVYTTINVQQTVTISGLPSTVYQAGPTAVVVATRTETVTSTVTEVAPRETNYAACQANNVGMYSVHSTEVRNSEMLTYEQ